MSKKLVVSAVAGVGVLAGLYSVAGYVGVPAGIKWALNNYAVGALGGRSVQIENIQFDPWNWSLTLEKLSVSSASDPNAKMIALDRLHADVNGSTLFKLTPIVDAIRVEGLRATLTNFGQHMGEVDKLLSALTTPTACPSFAPIGTAWAAAAGMNLPAFSLSNVELANSSLIFKNPKAGKTLSLTDINFTLPRLSTIDAAGAIPNVKPSFSMNINGKPVKALGETKSGLATLELDVAEVDVANAIGAMALDLPVEVKSLKTAVKAKVAYDLNDASGTAATLSGSLSGKTFNFSTIDKLYSGSIDAFGIDIGALDLRKQSVVLDRVYVTHPVIKASFQSQSTTAPAPIAKDATASSAGMQKPWSWKVAKAEITNGDVTLTDTSLKPAASLHIARLNASVSQLSSDDKKGGTYTASMQLDKGSLGSKGTLSLAPLTLKGTTEVTQFPFAPLNPWIQTLSGARIEQGTLTVKGDLSVNQGEQLAVKWLGSASVDNMTAKKDKTTLASWKGVAAENVSVSIADRPDIAIGLLKLEDPLQEVTQKTDKVLDLISAFASITGRTKTAEKAEKYKAKSHQTIEIKDILYVNNKFSVKGYDQGSLEALAVEKLNSIFENQPPQ